MGARGERRPDAVNILLVDDQPAKLLTYEAILEPLGENLIKAGSGKEALECLLRQEIAVVLADVCMPDLDGFELASMIHEHPRHQRTAIIFVSAVAQSDLDRLRGFERGGVDYVSVPVEPDLLRARVGVFADLHRKARELERLNQELEQRVAERTAEVSAAASRLRDSEAALREADRRKDEFLAMLSHELRNPLAPILNAVQILRQPSGQEGEYRWCLEVIDRQVGHLTRLIDDLLDVSRVTRGKLEIRRETLDLVEIVRRAADGMRPRLAAGGHDFRVALAREPIPVEADAVRLTQVVMNLLDNAGKFTPRGGTIWLSCDRGAGGAAIRVRDTGEGIASEDLPNLFQIFYQSRRGAAHVQGGIGVGLALVRRIVELHGGTIEARSAGPGQGSEFTLRLPVADRAPVSADRAEPEGADASPPARRRILVVDDNRDSADSLALLLRLQGNDVRIAYDGPEALAVAESFRPQVALLDIGLPVVDGREVARRIRLQPWGMSAALVAVTGRGQDEDRRRSSKAGFDAHLTKPVDAPGLRALLDGLAAPDRMAGRVPAR